VLLFSRNLAPQKPSADSLASFFFTLTASPYYLPSFIFPSQRASSLGLQCRKSLPIALLPSLSQNVFLKYLILFTGNQAFFLMSSPIFSSIATPPPPSPARFLDYIRCLFFNKHQILGIFFPSLSYYNTFLFSIVTVPQCPYSRSIPQFPSFQSHIFPLSSPQEGPPLFLPTF